MCGTFSTLISLYIDYIIGVFKINKKPFGNFQKIPLYLIYEYCE